MPLDIAVSRQYGDSTVTLRTNLPVTTGKGPVPLATVPVTTEAPATFGPRTVHCLITRSVDANGVSLPGAGACA